MSILVKGLNPKCTVILTDPHAYIIKEDSFKGLSITFWQGVRVI